MASIYAFSLLLMTVWIPVLLAVKLRRSRANWVWWAGLAVCFIGGFVVAWPTAQLQYALSDEMEAVGVPIPYVFFLLEDGYWVDYVVPGPAFVGLSNVLALASVCLLPLLVARAIFVRCRS